MIFYHSEAYICGKSSMLINLYYRNNVTISYTHIHTYTYIHTYMHTYIHTYILTYIHTYINMDS